MVDEEMINIRTEYSFRKVFGHIDKVAERCATIGLKAAAITDMDNTFGHYQWKKACEKVGIKPCYGVMLRVYETNVRERKVDHRWNTFVAKNDDGLHELYRLISTAYSEDHFYYNPRLFLSDLSDVFVNGNIVIMDDRNLMTPATVYSNNGVGYAGFDNYYPEPTDKPVYELMAEYVDNKTTAQHILPKKEWLQIYPDSESRWDFTEKFLLTATADLQSAPMVKYPEKFDIKQQCEIGAKLRKIDLSNTEYKERLERELDLIEEKDFTDYFAIVADLVNNAKEHMLVGPSRGSSAGSLVCYLLGITEIDPIPHGLIFERFIDINRFDLPDIDIDFPDNKRQIVIDYLKDKYGTDNVAHIGTVSKLKPKSAIGEFAKALNIPAYESKEVKDAIIERSGGDARAAMCIDDTLETTDAGKAFIAKYPAMKLVGKIEAHARHSGIHAAGILVCNHPVTEYAGFDSRNNISMIDKKDAEALNLLKIDVLGLRTLTILEQTLDQLDLPYSWLYNLPLNDSKTFQLFKDMRLSGVFQFEGYALQSLTRQMNVESFDDIVAITSLARPGPLHSGGATLFVSRRTGKEEVEYLSDDPAVVKNTKDTFGTIVFQEQLMTIGREFGGLSWEDVSELRKAASKSLGEEFFNKYKQNFLGGTRKRGIPDAEAVNVWSNMVTFGSWAFNKSHAVSYGLISYWSAYLKAHHPLEFAVATLNNARDDGQGVKVLRDMVKNDGLEYISFDKDHSLTDWSVHEGKLLGGLINIKGIGEKKAQMIIDKRLAGKKQTPAIQKLLDNAVTEYDDLFPVQTRFDDFYKNPKDHNIVTGKLSYLEDVTDDGTYIFIGKLVDRNLRDLNEYGNLVKRGGKIIKSNNLFLNFTVEDDTDSIICTIDRFKYNTMGKPIAESGKIGEDFYLIRGVIKNGWRKIYVEKVKRL